nr:hypothetical protein [Tanacetum cinerariifolium]
MEDTMLELVKICRQKKLLCMHDNVDDLIESALNSKLLSINPQRLDKKEQEVKNVVEQPVERRNRIIQSLQNFRVIHKSSTFLKDTSQISPVHAIAPILSTEEPKHSLSMGYEHLSTTPETKSDKVTESSAKNLLPIPREFEVTSEDDSKCDMPTKDDFSPAFTIFSNPLFNDNDDLDSSDDESLPDEDVPKEEFKIYSNPLFDNDEINSDKLDPHCFNEFSGALAHINPVLPGIKKADFDFEEEIRLIENLMYDNSSLRPPKELNVEIADTIIESLPSLPIPVRDGNSQREEIDIVIETDDVLPPSVENDDDSKGEINVVKELLRDNSISLTEDESSDSDHQDDLTFPRPLPKPPDAEFDAEEEISVVINEFDDKNNDYCSFMFVIQNFILYLICFKMFLSFLSAKSEDTIFDLEYDQSISTDRPIFLNDNKDHHVQNRESPENSSEENVVSKTNHEPPQDSDIHRLIEECSIEVPEEQKQNMEKMMLDLVKICHHKQFLCIHDDVDDLIEIALDSKLLSINSINFQRLDKKEQEVKIVEEQPAERRNHIEKSLQNFKVIHKSSISLNTSQISSIHEIAPILSTKEPENSLSMGYEHLSITLETESDEVTESNAKNLLPIPSECEVTSEDKRECDELVCDNHSNTFFDSKIDDDISVYDDDFEDIDITRLISNIESLNDNSTPDHMFNSFESDNSLLDNFSPEFETFCNHSEETRSGNTTHANYSLPEYDSFCFEIEPDQERLINLVENDIPDNSSNDPLLEEVDLFLSDDSIPPEPPDDNFDLEPEVISAVMEDIDEPDEHFNP